MANLQQRVITLTAVMVVLGAFGLLVRNGVMGPMPPGSQAMSVEQQSYTQSLSAELRSVIQTSFSELSSKLDRLGQNIPDMPSKLEKSRKPASSFGGLSREGNVYKRNLPDWSSIWQEVRIYVYPDSYSKDGPYKIELGYPYTEIFLYDNIRRIAVDSPENANLFCMPIQTINWGNTVNETSIAAMNNYFKNLYTKYPHWEKSVRKGHVNHFFIVGHDHGGNRASGSKYYLDRSILLANSASSCMGQIRCKDISWYGATPNWYSIGKDVSTVPFPSVWDPRKKQYPKLQNPRPDPKWTVSFVGGYRQRAPSIDLLLADPRVSEDPKWFIEHDGPSTKSKKRGIRESNYWNMLQQSKFALHIHGSQPFSPRLFEIIAAGTVPVIISPGYVLPFEDFLDWGTFSISLTADRTSQLYSILSNITNEQYDSLSSNVRRIRHHFLYNDPPQAGDAFYMTMWTTYFRSQTISLPYVSGDIQEGEVNPR